MTGVMAFCTLSASLIFYLGRKVIVKKATVKLVEEEDNTIASQELACIGGVCEI
jgi:hypothetical protein